MLSFGDGTLILFAGDKKVGEVRVDNVKAKEAVLKAEFAATNRLTLEFDPQGDNAGDWIGIFSPKVR
jgi:ABC-type branched-subunit amino acid transport system substrate-binding protein